MNEATRGSARVHGLFPSLKSGKIFLMTLLYQDQTVDRTAFEVSSLSEQGDERDYWWAKTPYERLIALEVMRQIVYGYDPSTTRLQRVLEVTQCE